ncbi:MAG: hypothetical protein WD042_00940 [Phycisphaeraceae bacterium]
MQQTILAHFDGRAIVPDEPLDLPAGQALQVTVSPVERGDERPQSSPIGAFLADWACKRSRVEDDGLPDDLAAQHDHYLYGTPKRS